MTFKIAYRVGTEDVMVRIQADTAEAALAQAQADAPTGTDFRVIAMSGK